MKNISVILVDDHQVIREGLKEFIQESNSVKVVGESQNGREALAWLDTNKADIVVTDLSMPGMDGIEFTRLCKLQNIDQKILILSVADDTNTVNKAISAGANGYLLKSCSKDEFISAIERVNSGKSVYDQEVTTTIIDNLLRKNNVKKDMQSEIPLSEKEKQTLKLLCEEVPITDISDQLGISARSVEFYKRNLLEKIGVKNVAGLLIYSLERRLFQ